MRSIVIVPTYNERENLSPLVEAVLEVEPGLDVLVVDDGSPDGTGEVAEGLAARDARVGVLRREGKQGLGAAYVAGFRYALERGYERVAQMDADFSHRPEDLPRLLRAVEGSVEGSTGDVDLAIGSRYVPGGGIEDWSAPRRLISRWGSFYARNLLGLPIRDCTAGFKCFRRRVLAALDLDGIESGGYGFQVEVNHLCHRAGFRILEVPITFADRASGRSKMSWQIVLEAALLVWRLRGRSIPPAASRPRITREPTARAGRKPIAAVGLERGRSGR